jgi:serine/threonine-protein kinase HipA
MAAQKHSRKPPATTQVELDVFLGAAEHAMGKLVYVRAGQREFSQFAYREGWLTDPRPST